MARSIKELRKAVEEIKVKEIWTAHCCKYGWKALARRFRKYLNENTPPRPEPGTRELLDWMDLRVEAAKRFRREEGLSKYKFNSLVNHVPLTKTKGYRECLRCYFENGKGRR
jgi:hypothetical protein